MTDNGTFRRAAGCCAVLASVLAVASLFVGLAGVDYDFDAFSGAEAILGAGAEAAPYIRWSLVFNLFGNYFLLIPLAILLWHALRTDSPMACDFATFAGLLFLSVGGIASGILIGIWPDLIVDYANAEGADREVIATAFVTFTRAIENGLQGPVQNLPGAIWLLGIGRLLKPRRRALGWLTLVFGFFMLLNGIGGLAGNATLSMIGFSGNFLILPFWALWIGIDLLRRPLAET